MSTILLIRHGKSQSNIGFRTTYPEEIALAGLGMEQAEQIAHYLEAFSPPDLIVTSSFKRTIQTAEPTKARFPDVPATIWPVREFTFLSEYEFLEPSSVEDRSGLKGMYWEICDPTLNDGPNAESFEQFIKRVQEVIQHIKNISKEYSYETIAVFSHEQFIRAVLWLLQSDSIKLDAETMRDFRNALKLVSLPNGAIVRVKMGNDQKHLQWELITSHLKNHPKKLGPILAGLSYAK